MPQKTVTVENYTSHPFHFVYHGNKTDNDVVVARAVLEQPNQNQPARVKPGTAEIPVRLLVRLLKDKSVRAWFDGSCKVVGAPLDALIAEPSDPNDPEPARAVDSQVGSARQALSENARLQAENLALADANAAMEKRLAALESAQKPAPETKPEGKAESDKGKAKA